MAGCDVRPFTMSTTGASLPNESTMSKPGTLTINGMQIDDAELQALLGTDVNSTVLSDAFSTPPFMTLPVMQPPPALQMTTLFPLTPAPSPLAFTATGHGIAGTGNPVVYLPSRPSPPTTRSIRSAPIPIKSKSDPNELLLSAKSSNNSPVISAADPSSGGDPQTKKPRKRRCFKELVRDVRCKHEGCNRVYATESSLQTHIRLKHNNLRPSNESEQSSISSAIKRKSISSKPSNSKTAANLRRNRIHSAPATKSTNSSSSSAKKSTASRVVSAASTTVLSTGIANNSLDAPLRSASDPTWNMPGQIANMLDFGDTELLGLEGLDAVLDFGSLDTDFSQFSVNSSEVEALIYAI